MNSTKKIKAAFTLSEMSHCAAFDKYCRRIGVYGAWIGTKTDGSNASEF